MSAPEPPLFREPVVSNAELQEMVRQTAAAITAAAEGGDPVATAILRKDTSSNPQTASSGLASKVVRRMAELVDETDSPATAFLKSVHRWRPGGNARSGPRSVSRGGVTYRRWSCFEQLV